MVNSLQQNATTRSRAAQDIHAAHDRLIASGGAPFVFPDEVGEGTLRSIVRCGGISVCEHAMCFRRATTFSGVGDPRVMSVHCCLGQEAEWERAGEASPRQFEVGCVLFGVESAERERVSYAAQRDYHFVSVRLSRPALACLLDAAAPDASRAARRALASGGEAPLGPALERRVRDLVDDVGNDAFASLRLQGKTFELLSLLFGELAGGGCRDALARRDVASLERAAAILDVRFADPPTYPELARMVGMSETTLSRGFKCVHGVTVHGYVLRRRMERACELLEQGAPSIAWVAAEVGYANPSHFSAAFKVFYGASPREFAAPRA